MSDVAEEKKSVKAKKKGVEQAPVAVAESLRVSRGVKKTNKMMYGD